MKKILTAAAIATSLGAPTLATADVQVYGQVNKIYVFGGDLVDEPAVYDSVVTGTRFGFKGSKKVSDTVSAGFKYEVQIQPQRSAFESGADNLEVRWAEGHFKTGAGKFTIGQGEPAASGSTDATYGNGNFFGTANLAWLAYRESHVANGGNAADLYAPFDVGASRTNRLQYNSPSLNGFTFAASINSLKGSSGSESENEIAIRYSGNVGPGKLSARLGSRDSDVNSNRSGGSLLYTLNSGFNIGLATGKDDDNSNLDYTMYTLGYKAKKWAASYEFADNDNNQEVTSYGVTYNVTKGVKAYFNAADFDVTDGMLVGLYIKF